jgi:hypothetical protein
LPPSTEPDVVIPDGDPAELRDVARFLHAAGEALTQVSANVWAAKSNVGVCWKGPAAYFFGVRVRETIASIDTVPTACHAAARGLEQLADAIEDARRRALDAEADAADAHRRIDAAAFEVVAAGATQIIDPPTYRLLERRLEEARDDLHTARALGARANQDLADSGRRTAAILHEAANSVRVPPPPPEAGIPPRETTRQWFHRQLGDFLVDPMTFWKQDETTYERGRIAFDVYTGATAGILDGADRFQGSIFRAITEVQILRGPIVIQNALILDPGLTGPGYTEFQRISYKPVAGPDPLAGSTIGRIAKAAKLAGWGIAGGTAALDQWVEDRNRRDLSGVQKAGRMLASALITGGSGVAGGSIGFQTGAFVVGGVAGSIAPGPGNVIGGIAGGVAGSVWGGGIGQAVGEKAKGWLFNWMKVN